MFPRPQRGGIVDYYPDWVTTCCGFGARSRDRFLERNRNYFYSPSAHHLDSGSSWAVATPHHYAAATAPQQQPYLLLTQPVIIASTQAAPAHFNNTMSLIQQPQQAGCATFPTMSLISQQATHQSPSIMSSQYAIYNSSAAVNTGSGLIPAQSIYDQQQIVAANQINYMLNKSPMMTIMEAGPPTTSPSMMMHPSSARQHHQQQQLVFPPPTPLTEKQNHQLNSEIFRKLEVIEKQVDLSGDMELIKRHGIVITRALDPYSLMPHLTEATLRKYNSHFLFNDDYVIRFIEVIKRPGQTLGLYIRTVQFEDPRGGGNTRIGVVITKIDSDSPIYNSQVLHVGDEILSINLIDIQGLSLDDVVIIMSIPKRLVLAIRIPRDRDQLLSINLMQQQQLLRNSIEQENEINNNNWINNYHHHQQQQSPPRQSDFSQQQQQLKLLNENNNQHQRVFGQTTISSSGNHELDTSSSIPQNRIITPSQHNTALPNNDSGEELSRELSWQMLNQDQDDVCLHRPIRVQSALQMNELISSSDSPRDEMGNKSHQTMNFNGDPLSRRYSGGGTGGAWSGHRTLPARPIAFSSNQSSLTVSNKQPNVITNIRLGDTPEQSNYFSSSIDAINRELKELRRQRMALSNN